MIAILEWASIVVVGVAAAVVGFAGCFVPALPGPAISYAALWFLYAMGYPPSTSRLVVGAVVTIAVSVVDNILPSLFARKCKCSRWGVFGCFAGGIIGLFFMPFGILLGPFIGTVAGELVSGKKAAESLRGGLVSLIGFVFCLWLKLVAVGLFAWWYFECVHSSM